MPADADADGKPDLRYVEAAAAQVAAVAEPGAILVLESTVPPGATERIFERALHARRNKSIDDFHVAHCPERVIPGAIMQELRANARVVGGRTPRDAEIVRDLYASFCDGEIALTSIAVAEFVKIVENTFRDVNIAFANELAIFAEELGVDVWETIALANKHPRVEHPAARDRASAATASRSIRNFLSNANPFVTELIQSARRVNDRMPFRIVRRIAELVDPGRGSKIALLGAAYKADVDDARESPAPRASTICCASAVLRRPYSTRTSTRFHRLLCGSLEEAVTGADALGFGHAAHGISADPTRPTYGVAMRRARLVDTRNFFDASEWQRMDSSATCWAGRCTLARQRRGGMTVLRRLALGFPITWSHRRRTPSRVWNDPGAGPYFIEWDPGSGTYGEDWTARPSRSTASCSADRHAYYHPIRIAQFALHRFGIWHAHAATRPLAAIFSRKRRGCAIGNTTMACPDSIALSFRGTSTALPAGWSSAMAQGEAISVLLRAHGLRRIARVTRCRRTRRATVLCRHRRRRRRLALRRGDVSRRDRQRTRAPRAQRLHLRALGSLGAVEAHRRAWLARIVERCVDTLRRWFRASTPGGGRFTASCSPPRDQPHIATLKYHQFHIAQMHVLGADVRRAEVRAMRPSVGPRTSRQRTSRSRVVATTLRSLPERLSRRDTVLGGAHT